MNRSMNGLKLRLHPIQARSIILWRNDHDESPDTISACRSRTSLVMFDSRQVWDCTYFNNNDDPGQEMMRGWECEWRHGVVVRLSEDEFAEIFGHWAEEET